MEYINVALGKGRLAEKGYEIFKKIGYDCSDFEKKSRKLVFENSEKGIRFILVKAQDVPIYVERGAADIGIVGKDTIMEEERDLYEILDLGFGKCKFSVAAPNSFQPEKMQGMLRVATKYPRVAQGYFMSKGRQIDVIKLNGSVELAPLVGLSDVIVDIVETGGTLKENGLEVIEDMYNVSARVVVNKVSFKTKNLKIKAIIEGIKEIIKEEA
ncbi:MAG: ATP phosphoribosyltransferase [Peptoclostridium sp.]|uniref:ATP phosphoribosyltransferase n=1 Tax=Peptoclostridium sp. TaxID=1904860 RepID=UPI00139AFC2F|nr:ATP phosphoribosyltransferase [Peptoclostridium sp.]MZQ75081.1 ATP phosphoribosyltransferase [Peptoclostridium sp.]